LRTIASLGRIEGTEAPEREQGKGEREGGGGGEGEGERERERERERRWKREPGGFIIDPFRRRSCPRSNLSLSPAPRSPPHPGVEHLRR